MEQDPQKKEFIVTPPESKEEEDFNRRVAAAIASATASIPPLERTQSVPPNILLPEPPSPKEPVPYVVNIDNTTQRNSDPVTTARETLRIRNIVGAEIADLPKPPTREQSSFNIDAMMPKESEAVPVQQPIVTPQVVTPPEGVQEVPTETRNPNFEETIPAHPFTETQPADYAPQIVTPNDVQRVSEEIHPGVFQDTIPAVDDQGFAVTQPMAYAVPLMAEDVFKSKTSPGVDGNRWADTEPMSSHETEGSRVSVADTHLDSSQQIGQHQEPVTVSPTTPETPVVQKTQENNMVTPPKSHVLRGIFGGISRLFGTKTKEPKKETDVERTLRIAKTLRPGPDTNTTIKITRPPTTQDQVAPTVGELKDIQPEEVERVFGKITTPTPREIDSVNAEEKRAWENVLGKKSSVVDKRSPEYIADLKKRLERAEKGITTINDETSKRERGLLERIGDGLRKNIFTKASAKIAEKFNALPPAIRYGTGLSIVAVGSLGIPFITPVLTLAAAGYKVISGVVLYSTLHTALDIQYKKLEKEGQEVSPSRKLIMEAGAIGVSAFLGHTLGQLLSNFMEGISGTETSPQTPPEPITTQESPIETPPTSIEPSSADIPPEIHQTLDIPTENITVATFENLPSMVHTVIPNERLWDIVKDHLFQSDTFKNLTLEAKNLEISKYIAYIAQEKIIPDVNALQVGQVIDFSKIDGKIPADILKQVNPFAK